MSMQEPPGKSKRRKPLAEVFMALALYDTSGWDSPENTYASPARPPAPEGLVRGSRTTRPGLQHLRTTLPRSRPRRVQLPHLLQSGAMRRCCSPQCPELPAVNGMHVQGWTQLPPSPGLACCLHTGPRLEHVLVRKTPHQLSTGVAAACRAADSMPAMQYAAGAVSWMLTWSGHLERRDWRMVTYLLYVNAGAVCKAGLPCFS